MGETERKQEEMARLAEAEDTATGADYHFEDLREALCYECGGKGSIHFPSSSWHEPPYSEMCETCNGAGWVR